jgi:hypothetical protein
MFIKGHLSSTERVALLIDFDADFKTLAMDMPPSSLYKTVVTQFDSDDIFEHRVDFYPDRHTTQTWNVLRLIRILLNESIQEEYLKASQESPGPFLAELSQQASQANPNIRLLAEDICASIPQYTEYFGSTQTELGYDRATTPPETPSQMLHCYSLIFPLYVAGQSVGSSDILRQWALRQLRCFATRFNIRNANLVANILEDHTCTNPWSIYALLGSYAFSA